MFTIPECMAAGCREPAAWEVADEDLTPPAAADGKFFETARIRAVRKYCSKHYRLPTITTPKGVTKEVNVEARPK